MNKNMRQMTNHLRANSLLPQMLSEAEAELRSKLQGDIPDTVVVLGSGFKGFESNLTDATVIELKDLPHFPCPRVEGHGTALVVGKLEGKRVAVLTGRVHLYEGYSAERVSFSVRVMARLGAKRLLLTNACGSLTHSLQPGQLVLVRDQINLTGQNCLIGAGDLAPVFVDMGKAFHEDWRNRIRAALRTAKLAVEDGVYIGVLGPNYETPAETRLLGQMGAQIVGMSTVQEVLAARHLGMDVACLSFVTNMAGGLGGALTHHEVVDLVVEHRERLHHSLSIALSC